MDIIKGDTPFFETSMTLTINEKQTAISYYIDYSVVVYFKETN